MTKYYIRIFPNNKIYPSIYENVDRYVIEKGVWLIMKWDERGRTMMVNVSGAQRICIDEMDEDAEHE